MDLIKFGNFTPLTPDQYDVELSDMDGENAGRSETGYMNRDRVRAGIYKISVGWTNMATADVKQLLDAISPESVRTAFFFGDLMTTDMYVGNRKITLKHREDGTAYWDVSFNMTEM